MGYQEIVERVERLEAIAGVSSNPADVGPTALAERIGALEENFAALQSNVDERLTELDKTVHGLKSRVGAVAGGNKQTAGREPVTT